MFGTIWIYESTFSTVNFLKSKCTSNISNENLVSKLRCAVSVKYTPDFEDNTKKECKMSH